MVDEEDIIEHHGAGTLLKLFIEHARRRPNDKGSEAFFSTLTKLHNDGEIDLLDPARQISTSSISQHDFFTVTHFYCELIPTLQADVSDMLAAVKALVARAGNDLASGMPNGAYRTWAEQGDRALTTLLTVQAQDPEDSAYIFLGLQALAKHSPNEALTRAIAYLEGPAAPARSAAAKAIGTISLETPETRLRAANALAAASATSDDNSLGHILAATCEIVRAHPNMEDAAVALIQSATPNIGDQAIHQLSLELMFHGQELPPNIVAALTATMNKVVIANRGTLDNIDAAAGKLVKLGRVDEALALVVPLIIAHDELTSIDAFDSFSHALLELAPDQLTKVIIGWLLSSDHNLGQAVLSLVSDHHGDAPLILDVDSANLEQVDTEKVLIGYRAIGYLFTRPITAASLILGLISSVSEASRSTLVEILFDPLLINYSGELADWLSERANATSDPVKPILEGLLGRLEAYIEGLRKAGRIKELYPSERERLIEGHRRHETMRQIHAQAEKKSVFMSLVSRSVLLYGNRSISYFEELDGKKRRNEMKLHGFSHSIESPRLDILEPFELDYTLRSFRAMQVAKP